MKRIFKYLGGEKDPNLSQSHTQESESSSTTAFQQQIGSSKKDTITQFSGNNYNYYNYYYYFICLIVYCILYL